MTYKSLQSKTCEQEKHKKQENMKIKLCFTESDWVVD